MQRRKCKELKHVSAKLQKKKKSITFSNSDSIKHFNPTLPTDRCGKQFQGKKIQKLADISNIMKINGTPSK